MGLVSVQRSFSVETTGEWRVAVRRLLHYNTKHTLHNTLTLEHLIEQVQASHTCARPKSSAVIIILRSLNDLAAGRSALSMVVARNPALSERRHVAHKIHHPTVFTYSAEQRSRGEPGP